MVQPDVIVIGAGVVGLSAALAAQARGLSVTVIDREGPAAGASAGNAGAFAFSDILPLASPRIIRQAPKWLLDPLGPLSVPPAYALRIAPWMLRFWRASWPAQVAASTRAQTAMMRHSRAALESMLSREGLGHFLRRDGQLQVYEGAREFDASLPGWAARQAEGIEFRHLKGDEIAEIQPGLAPRFTHATFTPGWWSVTDPRDYTLALAEQVRARGGQIVVAEATALVPGGVQTATGVMQAERIVLAAGAFSHRLARTAGVRIPLETERGYNTTLPVDAFDLRTQITFGGHGFVVSRLSTGIRVGGAVELGGLDLPPNYARADAMLKKATDFLPGLRTTGGTQWMGFRPSLPDSLPAIGPLKPRPDVICAFGHGHLGLTQSAGTAEIVADLLTGRAPGIDMTPYAPHRF
ncbi:FAD-binding oxidoreductase [Halovulum dunhuangense]|uniref:FAD-binding oxidoreductase n=1 Tax=Halovulum dunhuangense TaxID=1505036 RepID=A0A849L1D1_9RHOB|nr:FAD-binding oxidoreductase [Halovulum dunhuangense]